MQPKHADLIENVVKESGVLQAAPPVVYITGKVKEVEN